tara:strand:+ start:491 stop:781 length:291 start_codon:yes stop_codon:yes gene_type:complete
MTNLQELKDRIEKMESYHQIEILRILVNTHGLSINENKNGTFINLTEVGDETIAELLNYVAYVDEQTQQLELVESEKSHIQETFFKDNKDKRNVKI